jgi:hypothetical protein
VNHAAIDEAVNQSVEASTFSLTRMANIFDILAQYKEANGYLKGVINSITRHPTPEAVPAAAALDARTKPRTSRCHWRRLRAATTISQRPSAPLVAADTH